MAAVTTTARGSCLASYRVDVPSQAWAVLAMGAVLTTVGGVSLCTAFVSRGLFQHSDAISAVGAMCMLVGPFMAVFGMQRLMSQDEYLAALEQGLLMYVAKEERFVEWGDIDAIRWDAASGSVQIALREGAPIAIARAFVRTSPEKLASELDDVRRKAAFRGV